MRVWSFDASVSSVFNRQNPFDSNAEMLLGILRGVMIPVGFNKGIRTPGIVVPEARAGLRHKGAQESSVGGRFAFRALLC